jgi:hypothetical protein
MGEGLHVTSESFLQLTNQSSMQRGAFKYKEESFDEWLHVVVVHVLRINHMGFVQGG